MYLEIAVSISNISGVFDYELPADLEDNVLVGSLVTIPFGHQMVQGVVLQFKDHPAFTPTRPITDIVDREVVLTAGQIALARRISEQTLSPLAACIDLMLPPGLGQQADMLYSLVSESKPNSLPESLPTNQKKIVNLLSSRGSLNNQQIEKALSRINWHSAMRQLINKGMISTQTILPEPRVKPKSVRTVQLACTPETALNSMQTLARQGSMALERRQAMLKYLIHSPGPVEATWIYAESGGNLQDLYALVERDLIILGESEIWRDPLDSIDFPLTNFLQLTKDQTQVWEQIAAIFQQQKNHENQRPMLLHGITGSGKTEIYLKAIAEVLRSGKQAIMLVPEIALTPQTIRRIASRFPGQVGLIHSMLSLGERYDTWRRARAGLLSIIVGPRSALFTPLANLGLIIIDECHDDSYYQSDHLPYYNTRQAAIDYASITGALCLMGSATPDVTDTFRASQGEFHYLHLPSRILAHRDVVKAQLERGIISHSLYQSLEFNAETIDLPKVHLVDMRQELQAGNRSIFSRLLRTMVGNVLEQGQQAILFLNRRGSATYIFCRDCGYSLQCPRCDLPLTFHADRVPELICHHCGYSRKVPLRCPSCSSPHIRHFGAGTQTVEKEVQTTFPEARTIRWDYDTTRKKGSHELIMNQFANRRADILIGTQMLAKGLDMPLVTLVGVILADVGLNLPDYRAGERTFQTLTQVAGRAGRSPLGGQVVLQTFQPEHYVIQAAAKHNYRDFYQQEITYRQRLRYPPFTNLVRLEYRGIDPNKVEQVAQELSAEINQIISEGNYTTEMIGPVPCFYSRIEGKYRWQIILRGNNPSLLVQQLSLGQWKIEVNPPNLL